jgi:hypothetical protein
MKAVFAACFMIAVSFAAVEATSHRAAAPHPRGQTANRRPVVVELFTSEGCSSCPPADSLLTGLAEQQPVDGAEIIALEEHVDYWNDLGWRDPFSSGDWTARQSVYAEVLRNGNPYTPQMVVDGSVEFVGSHAGRAGQAIQEAAREEKIPVALSLENPSAAGTQNLRVEVGKLERITKGDTADVWLAVTEAGLHSAVTRGENAGADLHHAAVVRSLRKIGEAKGAGENSYAGDVSLPLRAEWKRENLRAVVFVQEKKSRRIVGAAEVRVAR